MSYAEAKKHRIRLGRAGETAAARMLQLQGMELLTRNCRTRRAELDLVMRDGRLLVFVEVKTRYHHRGTPIPRPASNLKEAQKRRIYRGAFSYLHELGDPPLRFRFDLVEVVYGFSGPERIRHWPSHFGKEKLFRGKTFSRNS